MILRYLIDLGSSGPRHDHVDDDAAEQDVHENGQSQESQGGKKKRKDREKKKQMTGQNIMRHHGRHDDSLKLCSALAHSNEFSPKQCSFGDKCNKCHDLRKYLNEGRRGDLETFAGKCPVFEAHGRCASGWRCRFVKSHSKEIDHENGRKELVLVESETSSPPIIHVSDENAEQQPGVVNIVSLGDRVSLNRKRFDFTNSEIMTKWIEAKKVYDNKKLSKHSKGKNPRRAMTDFEVEAQAEDVEGSADEETFMDVPLKPSEKRRVYFGAQTPVLAPLTTQGNLPFRRLCVESGAQVTYSEMAMGLPLLQGQKTDWALMKAHESEVSPPKVSGKPKFIVQGYDNSRDLKFGAQISGSHPWVVTKAIEALTRLCPRIRVVDLNCGCPIDMIFKAGAGSGLLECPSKLERMVRGMNTVSGEVPVTVKLRTGVKENKLTAKELIERLAFGHYRDRDSIGAPGCAAVTLHGRSRRQRYTGAADWSYIAECAALVQSYRDKSDDLVDTVREPDPSTQPAAGQLYFLGNGDCYSHEDYSSQLSSAKVDSVMIGRGAMIKPWLFEEIQAGQYLDKSATERLGYVEKFCRYGMEAWGSDEMGIGFTRRFLLEWLSFTYRYIPVGILEHLPPRLNDRPPAFKGRNDLEMLLASNNYKDWIKIRLVFLYILIYLVVEFQFLLVPAFPANSENVNTD